MVSGGRYEAEEELEEWITTELAAPQVVVMG
jgi:hypothetical protein